MNQFEMRQKAYQSTLTSRALQVLLYLIDRADKAQTCFPAVPTIGQELHISISTVKRAMKELISSGYVSRESRFREKNGGQTSNLYTLSFPEQPESEEEERQRQEQGECVKSVPADSMVGENEVTDSAGTYGGRAFMNRDTKLGKQTKKGCSKGEGKRNGKKSDMDKRNIRSLRRIWTGEGVIMIPP